jgi:DNA-binding SARP family transcriptional activator
MLGEFRDDLREWSTEVEDLIGDIAAFAEKSGDRILDGALSAAREAMLAWHGRHEQMAYQEQARATARRQERRARQRVCLVLDLAAQLAEIPRATPRGPDGEREGRHVPAARPAQPAGLAARLLGAFDLRVADVPVENWRGRRGPAVLQFLLGRRSSVDREVIIEALWPGMSPDTGRPRLHQAVYTLRRTLHEIDPSHEYVLCEGGSYRLNPETPLWTDIAEFDRLVSEGDAAHDAGMAPAATEAYRAAERLYRGDLLENCPFTDWAADERRRLRDRYVVIGTRLAGLYAGAGDHSSVLAVCARVLARDPFHEGAICSLMRSYAATGNRSLALQAYRSFEAELDSELGVAPSAEGQDLFRRILTTSGEP